MKEKLVIVTIAFVIAMLLTSAVYGDECRDVLEKAAYDEIQITQSSDFNSQVKEVLSWSLDNIHKESEKSDTSLGLIAKAIILNFGKSGEQKSLDDLQARFNSDKDNFVKSSILVELAQKMVNKSALEAWNNCINGKKVLAWYTGDCFDTPIIQIKYRAHDGADPKYLQISQVDFVNLEVPAGAKMRLVEGTKINKGSSIQQKLSRLDIDKDASIAVVFKDIADPVNVKLSKFEPPPPPPIATIVRLDAPVKVIGGRKCGGIDCGMDTDPNDRVTVTCSTYLSNDAKSVSVSVDYTCEEYKGNHTKICVSKTVKVYDAPQNMRIVSIDANGGRSFVQNLNARGRNHGFRPFKTKNTYWTPLYFRVDSGDSNDCNDVGVQGSLYFLVSLMPE